MIKNSGQSSASIHWLTGLTKLFLSLWQFLVLFWMLWMLVTMHRPCHVPHVSRITAWRTIFKKYFLVCPRNESDLSHVFMIAYHKMLTKELLAVHPEKVTERKKRKKTRKTIGKLFALNANAKITSKIYVKSWNSY